MKQGLFLETTVGSTQANKTGRNSSKPSLEPM